MQRPYFDAVKSQALIWSYWQVQSQPSQCLGKCACSFSPDSSWTIESGNPFPIPNDACINIMLSILRQYRQGTLAPCKNFVFGFFYASNLLWALGGFSASYYTF